MALTQAVRVQALNGLWETLGVDRWPDIQPEQIRPAADQLGPSTLSFQIQRDPNLVHPDLSAWTPCEIQIGGLTVWDGRIKETPTQKGAQSLMTVNGVGYQSHLDDDALERGYVHQDITTWQDARSNPNADLSRWVSSPTVTTDKGQITLAWPAGTPIPNGVGFGITLDLGPGGAGTLLQFDGTFVNSTANLILFARGHAGPDAIANPGTLTNTYDTGVTIASGTHTNLGGLLANTGGYQYLSIFMFANAAIAAPAADISLKITRIIVGQASGTGRQYVSDGNGATPNGQGQSNLRASDIVSDVLGTICPLYTVTLRSPAYRDEILADSPLSYWRLGSNANLPSNVALTGGQSYTADIGSLNNPLTSTPNVATAGSLLIDDADGSLSFNGSTAYAQAATSTAYGSAGVSLEATIMPTAIPAGGTFAEIVRIEGWCALRLNGSTIEFFGWMNTGITGWKTNAIAIAANTIYHIMALYDGTGNAYIVVNGNSQFSANLTQTVYSGTGPGPLTVATGIVQIGAFSTGTPTEMFTGLIDEIAVYPYILDPNQQQQHYQAARARAYGGIQRTQSKIPHYYPSGAKTAREHLAAGNALHNWQIKIPVGRVPIFQPQASRPLLKTRSDLEFQDAGANDGEVIYNKCIVEGLDATGKAVRVTVRAADVTPGTNPTTNGIPQPADPGFETGLSGGTASTGTLTRSTLRHRSGIASAALAGAPAAHGITNTAGQATWPVTGPWRTGVPYTFTAWIYIAAGSSIQAFMRFGQAADTATGQTISPTHGSWQPLTVTWTPQAQYSTANMTITFTQYAPPGTFSIITFSGNVDDMQISNQQPTIVDRRGFIRTKILQANAAIDPPTATLLANAFILDSLDSPFRGSFTVTAPDDIVLLPQETTVHPSELLLHTGELVSITSVIDPNIGDLGRLGKIVQVNYDADAETAQVTIDDDRNNLQALMNRMAINSAARNV